MGDGNPLVAERQDSTTWHSGINLLDDAAGVYDGVSSGSWVEGGIAAFGTALDVLSMAMNPVGTLISYGLNFLIEHVEPLRNALNQLAGDADQIAAYAQTWKNVSKAVGQSATDLNTTVTTDTANWTGDAADAYRANLGDKVNHLNAAASCAETIGSAVEIVGVITGAVRMLVRDMVTQAIGDFIQDALEEVFSLGLGTPVVVAQVVSQVSAWMEKIGAVIKKLINSVEKLRPLMSKLEEIFAAIKKVMSELHLRHGDEPRIHGEDAPGTHASSATDPHGLTTGDTPHTSDGSTTPSHTEDGTVPAGDGSTTSPDGRPATDEPSASNSTDDPRRTAQDDKSTCTNGDPINVYTGEVVLPQTDVELAGVLPLILRRRHSSNYRLGRLFGPSWASTLDQRLEVDAQRVYFLAEDGRVLVFPIPGAQPVEPVEGPRWRLHRDNAGGYQLAQPETGQTLWFEQADAPVLRLSAVTSRYRHRIDLRYAEDGTLTEVAHSGGYRIAVDTSGGLVTGLALLGGPADEPDIPLLRFGYRDRRLVEVANSSGRPQRFDYDAEGRVVRWEDRNGEWYRFEFDELGRCRRTEGSGDALAGSLDIDTERRMSVWTDSLGHRTTYHFNELNQIVREVDPLGHAVESQWDRYDRLLARTDPLGRTTRYGYDEAGNLAVITRPDGSLQSVEFNALGLPVAVVNPDGAVWRRAYDDAGNLVATSDPLGTATRYGYDERGHLSSVTDPLGGRHLVATDVAGLPTSITDPRGATIRYERDQFGRITAITDPLGAVTRYGWTVEGLPLHRTRPDGQTEWWLHDGEGNHTEHTDALGQRTRVECTHFDLPSAVTGPDGARLEYRYDSQLRLVEVTNPQGQVWRYTYDAAGNLVAETDFTGRELRYAYDAAGQIVERTNGAGQTTRLRWDVLGNLVERRSDDGTFATFGYDAAGRIVRAVNADAEVVIDYDRAGRAIAETINGNTVTTEYDPMGRLVARRTPTGLRSVWTYDATSDPTALRTTAGTIGFGYDLAGREVRRQFGADVVLAQAWDASARLTGQSVTAGQRQVQRRGYEYRPDDNVIAINDVLVGTQRFDLDFAGRVRSVTGAAAAERYTYDRSGNLATDREHYGYDRQGRVILRQRKRLSAKPATWHYAWNAEDRLIQVTTPDRVRWRYRYDALGRRIAKQRLAEDGSVAEHTDFFWDGTLLAEQVHSGGRATSWDWTPNGFRPVSQIERVRNAAQEWVDEQFYGIVTDLIGTPTELLDRSGTPVWRATQSVWGEDLSGPGGAAYTPLRFPGQYHDPESGFNYNYQRYYMPQAARYASPDPLGLLPAPNPYGYVPNPRSWLDPLGLVPCRDCTARSDDLPKGDNRWYDSRREAFNAAKDRAGIPRSQQPVKQWTVGDDVTRRGMSNYVYDTNPGAHGRYYQYDTPNGPRVVAEHTSDPRAPHPHFHAYQPKEGAGGIVPGEKYARVGEPHHYYHGSHDPNWTP